MNSPFWSVIGWGVLKLRQFKTNWRWQQWKQCASIAIPKCFSSPVDESSQLVFQTLLVVATVGKFWGYLYLMRVFFFVISQLPYDWQKNKFCICAQRTWARPALIGSPFIICQAVHGPYPINLTLGGKPAAVYPFPTYKFQPLKLHTFIAIQWVLVEAGEIRGLRATELGTTHVSLRLPFSQHAHDMTFRAEFVRSSVISASIRTKCI